MNICSILESDFDFVANCISTKSSKGQNHLNDFDFPLVELFLQARKTTVIFQIQNL